MNIILSNFYQNYLQNRFLIDDFHQQEFFVISGVYGSFPFSFYRSENNVNGDDHIGFYTQMIEAVNNYNKIPVIILDFANPLIEEKDYHNRHCIIQMETFSDKDNIYFSVGQKEFAEYLVKQYPNIQLILNLDFMNYDEDIPNVIGVISSNIDKMNGIDLPMMIYRMELYSCMNCNHKSACIKQEQQFILDYSIKTMFSEQCKSLKFLNPNEIIENFAEAERNNINAILFEPPKINSQLYYELISKSLKEGDVTNDKF